MNKNLLILLMIGIPAIFVAIIQKSGCKDFRVTYILFSFAIISGICIQIEKRKLDDKEIKHINKVKVG